MQDQNCVTRLSRHRLCLAYSNLDNLAPQCFGADKSGFSPSWGIMLIPVLEPQGSKTVAGLMTSNTELGFRAGGVLGPVYAAAKSIYNKLLP